MFSVEIYNWKSLPEISVFPFFIEDLEVKTPLVLSSSNLYIDIPNYLSGEKKKERKKVVLVFLFPES